MESKIENSTDAFREMALCFISYKQRIKNKNCDELELAKEKGVHFF